MSIIRIVLINKNRKRGTSICQHISFMHSLKITDQKCREDF